MKKQNAGIPLWQDGLGRGLMILGAVAAAAAFIFALDAVRVSAAERLWLETWRMLGFFVFTGFFALLAWRPRLSAGVWELLFLNKAALVVLGLVYGSRESLSAATIDAVLVALLAAAYLCTRGWRSWWRREGA